MDNITLNKANELREEINTLDRFMDEMISYSHSGLLSIVFKMPKPSFSIRRKSQYGLEEKELTLDADMEYEVLQIIANKKRQLKKEFESL